MAIHRKILRWLENELFEGNIQLGQDLPTDSEIARAIGAGRSRTREGLRTLEDMDLVQLYTGRGKDMLVRLSAEPASAASPALRLHMSSSRYPTRDLVQTRILLESWAIARIDPQTTSFAEMDDVLEQMEDIDLSIHDFLELLLNFHSQIMRCAGNELLVGLLASVHQSSYESMLSLVGRMSLWSSVVERLRAESRAIAEALKAGDSSTARTMVISPLRGMYAEAGIDLEQEATSAIGLPGEPIASAFSPVDLDEFGADDLVEDFENTAVSDPAFADAEDSQPIAVPAGAASHDSASWNSVQGARQTPAPQALAVAPTTGPLASENQRSEKPSSGKPQTEEQSGYSTPAGHVDAPRERTVPVPSNSSVPTGPSESGAQAIVAPHSGPQAAVKTSAHHSAGAGVPLSFGTPHHRPAAQPGVVASAAPRVQPSMLTAPPVPVEEPGTPKVLRASLTAPRRRSGQITSPVRATIIKPADRSRTLVAPGKLTGRKTDPLGVAGSAATERETALGVSSREDSDQARENRAQAARSATSASGKTSLEAAATLHDTYEKLPHEGEQPQEHKGLLSKVKRFFGVVVYEPAATAEPEAAPASSKSTSSKPASPESSTAAPKAEAQARAEAERVERLKTVNAAEPAPERASGHEGATSVAVKKPANGEPADASKPADSVSAAGANSKLAASEASAEQSADAADSKSGAKKTEKKRR